MDALTGVRKTITSPTATENVARKEFGSMEVDKLFCLLSELFSKVEMRVRLWGQIFFIVHDGPNDNQRPCNEHIWEI